MNIPVPRWLVNAWDAFGDWGNVPVTRCRHYEIVRLDILMVAAFTGVTGYYWVLYGWRGGLHGGVMFIMLAALALLMRR